MPGESVTLQMELETEQHLMDVVVGCAIRRSDGLLVSESSTEAAIGSMEVPPGRTLVECRLGPMPLGAGTYNLSLSAWPEGNRLQPYQRWDEALTFFVGSVRCV